MFRAVLLATGLASVLSSGASAQDQNAVDLNALSAKGIPISTITPVFHQLVMFSLPAGFETIAEDTRGDRYIRESVRKGETGARWTEMITLTGAKDLATNPNFTAQRFLEGIAVGFKRACPDTFSIQGIGPLKFGESDAFAGLVGCGAVESGGYKHSEVALMISIQGSSDVYTIQWAERAAASSQPIALNDEKWKTRFKQLNPIRLCPVIPGEPPPFPSCINQK